MERAVRRVYAIRDFLHRSGIPFEWIELANDEQARAIGLDNADDSRTSFCLFAEGTRMENPTLRQLLQKLG